MQSERIVKLTVYDDSTMAWFVSAKRDPTYLREVDNEKAERWLAIQTLWDQMQKEIQEEVRG